MDLEKLQQEYGPDYYASRLGPFPYERSSVWLSFFSQIADQVIRALHPRRVFDAGCAMGFLVEAFWDRGVYCEGLDLSEFAISKVRRDIKEYCLVGSITTPITERFDVITCIEVVEHLPEDQAVTAIGNLCAAADVVLFSSTPTDLDEPTHYTVRPTLYWLELFANFGFQPDARFDASFVAPHAMLLRKGPPPPDDFLLLFSEYIRQKNTLATRSKELQEAAVQLQSLRSDQSAQAPIAETKHAAVPDASETNDFEVESAANRQLELEDELSTAQERAASLTAERDAQNSEIVGLRKEVKEFDAQVKALEAKSMWLTLQVESAEGELDKAHQRLANGSAQRGWLRREIERLSASRARQIQPIPDKEGTELTKIDESGRDSKALSEAVERLRIETSRNESLAEKLKSSDAARIELQASFDSVLASRAWRVAEKCRVPLRRIRTDWPQLYRAARFVKGKLIPPMTRGDDAARLEPVVNLGPNLGQLKPQDGRVPAPIGSADPAYQKWIDEQEPTTEDLERQAISAGLTGGPLFSIVVPVYDTDFNALRSCIESVLEQTYQRWELCIAFAAGGDPRNADLLRDLSSTESRVRIAELSQNLGISLNTNVALDLASGEYVALLDHDDVLAPFALFEVAASLQTKPEADLVYSDHDYLDLETGRRCHPLFKPDWSPEIMLSSNYITHLTVLRRSLMEQVGRFDPATDGAQDWDLFLRIASRSKQFVHIPKVLYHWRMHPASTARNDSAKNYAAEAQLLAIRNYLDRSCIDGRPEVMPNGLLHVNFDPPSDALVSIIIPTKDRVDLLSRTLSTLLALTEQPSFEILILDNGSQEKETREYLESLKEDRRIRIIWNPGPFNYSAANNLAIREARGNFFLFLNNDLEITTPDWLAELVAWANCQPIGIVGAKLLRANGSIQHAGVILGMGGFADHAFADEPAIDFGLAGSTGWYRNFLAITGACMMMRREMFEKLGGFNEAFTLCGSDVELCLRAHAQGYRILYNPFAELIHYEQQTRGHEIPASDFVESFMHYRPWILNGDPYWNPNLSLWSRRPSFRRQNELSSLAFAERHLAQLEPSPVAKNAQLHGDDVSRFDCSLEDFERLKKERDAISGLHPIRRVLWFIPTFKVPFYGGIFTVLSFAESWARKHNVDNLFAICDASDHRSMVQRIRAVYPEFDEANLYILDRTEQAVELPEVDASICTLWKTSYYAMRHRSVARRFYLIQDFEPSFYPAGSTSALVETTYRMGLYGIANTVSLKKMYESEYGGRAIFFNPSVNLRVFQPRESQEGSKPNGPWLVFCYGRPTHPRNSFELLSAALRRVKQSLGERVWIVAAGEEWKPADYGLEGIVENLGILAYEDTARLYRDSDLGVVLMLTRHPSYIPLELMASGCLVVTNVNSWTSWLLRDGENCLLSQTTATAIAETIQRGLLDFELRKRITENALEMVKNEYLDWSSQAENVYKYLCDPEAHHGPEMEERQHFEAHA